MPVEVVDAIVVVYTHRDTHEVQLVSPPGTPIATVSINKDSAGYSDLLGWIVTHAPGPRLAVSSQATRSRSKRSHRRARNPQVGNASSSS